jgi:hypothetical protein
VYTSFWLDPHRYRALAYLQGSHIPRSCRGVKSTVGTIGGGRWLGDRSALHARACRCGAVRVEASHGFGKLRVMLPSLSVASATTPGKRFAAGTVASFVKGGIGYREWARRNGRLADIHSIDDRYDHDIDELIA